MREQDITKLEFLMMVNDNIIVQRYFNVREFNPDARNSMDFKEYMDELLENLNHQLKMEILHMHIFLLDLVEPERQVLLEFLQKKLVLQQMILLKLMLLQILALMIFAL